MKRGLILSLLLASSAAASERLQGPTELLYWNKDKAYNGYTLFGVGGRSYLIDMEGRVVHTWPTGDESAALGEWQPPGRHARRSQWLSGLPGSGLGRPGRVGVHGATRGLCAAS